MTVDPKTFDLRAALAGQTYPTRKAIIPLDGEKLARLADREEALRIATHKKLDTAVIESEIADLKKEALDSALIVVVQGLSQEKQEELQRLFAKVADRDKPEDMSKYDFDLENGRELVIATWHARIREIRYTDGVISPVSEEDVETLLANLTLKGQDIVQGAIQDVDRTSNTGYESVIRDVDFSSAL